MNVIDLFSGVGGFSCGLKQAGFNILYANEIDTNISKSYKRNHPNTEMINSDISDFIPLYKKLFNKNTSEIDLIVGGPPCQGFSMAGSRIRRSKFLDDPRNYLFRKYFDVIQEFEPKYFIMENVSGLVNMNSGSILREIERLFQNKENFENGPYFLQKKIFETDQIGVPQKRKRLIIVGSKYKFNLEDTIETIKTDIKYSKFNRKNTIHDAIFDLSFHNPIMHSGDYLPYYNETTSTYQKEMRKDSNMVVNHNVFNHSKKVIDRMKRIKPGENWTSLEEKDNIKSVHSGAYGRMEWDKKSMTITTRFDTPSGGRFIHPDYNRNITAREAARLQSFPDSFIFYGNKTSICKQIGNAVPPYLGEFLGYIIKTLEDDNRR